MRRLPAPELEPPGPKLLASVLEIPNRGEFRLPTGGPKFSWLNRLRAEALRVTL